MIGPKATFLCPIPTCAAQSCAITQAELDRIVVGDAQFDVGHIRNRSKSGDQLDVDILGELDCEIDLNAELIARISVLRSSE